MKEVIDSAAREGFKRELTQKAARTLPILRRPRELRGPWEWSLPNEDQQVPVLYRCPLAECPIRREGWMPFGLSRQLFAVGLVRYQIRGRLRHARSGEESEGLVRLRRNPLGEPPPDD